MTEFYYVFKDDEHRLYYFASSTQETTYEKPAEGVFLDPDTNEEFDFSPYEGTAAQDNQQIEVQCEQQQESHPEQAAQEQAEQENQNAPVPKANTRKSQSSVEIRLHETTETFPEISNDEISSKPITKQRSQTLRPIHDRKRKKRHSSSKKKYDSLIIDVPNEEIRFQPPEETKPEQEQQADHKRDSFYPDPKKLSLPESLKNEIHQFQTEDFAKKFFKEKRSAHRFSRKKVSVESLAEFQNTSLSEPLSHSIPKNLTKDAITCFNCILNYTRANKDKPKPMQIESIIRIAQKSPPLVDELYFQLIKQTNKNPNEECLIKTWELFVIIASIFPSSIDSECWIKSHLSREATRDDNKTVADYAQFSYIRFSTRCTIGKPLENVLKPSSLINDVYSSRIRFGSSIYEQLWNQRETHKSYPFPAIIKQMADLLLSKGAETYEGIFRLPGSGKVIKDTQDKINQGAEIDPNMTMNDLASLFKSWFALLPDKLIPAKSKNDLQSAFEDKDYAGFIEKLPKTHIYALKYLIGFLQRLAKASAVTKMTANNLAICFGPNLVDNTDVLDMAGFEKYKNNVNEMLVNLIEVLDTSDIYPGHYDESNPE